MTVKRGFYEVQCLIHVFVAPILPYEQESKSIEADQINRTNKAYQYWLDRSPSNKPLKKTLIPEDVRKLA